MYIQTSTWVVRVGTSATERRQLLYRRKQSEELYLSERFTWVNSARQWAIALSYAYDAPCHGRRASALAAPTRQTYSSARVQSACLRLPRCQEGCHRLESAAACLFVCSPCQELAVCAVHKTSWSGPTGVAANALTRLARIGAGTVTRRRDTITRRYTYVHNWVPDLGH